jgi:two-component system response regulator AtoC
MTLPLEHVLVVDDDAAVGTVLAGLLHQGGIASSWVASGALALKELSLHAFDAVVTDLRMPSMNGMELLRQIGTRFPEVPVIMMTAYGTVPIAVEAIKSGAADFVLKPFDRQEILYTVRKVLAAAPQLEKKTAALPGANALLGNSEAMHEVGRMLDRAAQGDATVILRGESGTGKEVAARELHQRSRRRSGPFMKVHCAALPDQLLESELFGYEKGAFTGASYRKAGRVELSQGGTLFLDEIGDITPAVQVKLLRLLQDRAYERLGGTSTINADVRFVAATHRNLNEMVKAGQFREDLFYRLNVVPIWMPPLRDRRDDVARLALHFCSAISAANGKPPMELEPDALQRLTSQRWPGNVRQLQNLVERLIVLSDGPSLTLGDVERELARDRDSDADPAPASPRFSLESRRLDAEKSALQEAMSRADGSRTQAARLLGISRRTFYTKLAEHGLT